MPTDAPARPEKTDEAKKGSKKDRLRRLQVPGRLRNLPMPGPKAALGIALAFIGAGALLVSLAYGGDTEAQPLGPNRAVNAGAADARDITSHNSPTLVRNPVDAKNLVIANRIDTPRYSCALHVSADAGASWSQTPLPVPRGEEPKCYAPDVTFDAAGTLYLSFVTLAGRGNEPHAAWVSTSTDGGRTLSTPTKSIGDELSFGVRILADPTTRGRVHLTWLQGRQVALFSLVTPGNPILSKRSDDGGKTWSKPVRVSGPEHARAVAPTPAIAADGALNVAYVDLGDDRLNYEGAHEGRGGVPYDGTWSLVLSRSSDRGATWREAIIEPRVVPTERFVVFIAPTPSLALSADGRKMYVAFPDGTRGDADVKLWRSSDGGASWASTRVNDTPRGARRTQNLPQVDVAANGRVDVLYLDRRADPSDDLNEASLQSSFDGGKTFEPRVRLTDRAFDSRIGFGSERGMPDLGSRLALLSDRQRALAVWPDTRGGTRDTGKQDLQREVIAFIEPARLADGLKAALRVGGGALLLVGLVLILAPLRTRAGGLLGRLGRKEKQPPAADA